MGGTDIIGKNRTKAISTALTNMLHGIRWLLSCCIALPVAYRGRASLSIWTSGIDTNIISLAVNRGLVAAESVVASERV